MKCSLRIFSTFPNQLFRRGFRNSSQPCLEDELLTLNSDDHAFAHVRVGSSHEQGSPLTACPLRPFVYRVARQSSTSLFSP